MATSTPTAPRRRTRFFKHSYAQEGEDLILAELFQGRRDGFFVDVGAHHPQRFSNTYHLYRFRGWRGINIDATPGSMRAFRRTRPGDVNLEVAISDRPGTLEFFMFDEPALNTCDPGLAATWQASGAHHLVRRVDVEVRTLADVLRQHVPAGSRFDLLTVDVEGLDLNVLKSNDWEAYRPVVVAVEDLGDRRLRDVGSSPISELLAPWGYEPFAGTSRTVLYRRPE